MYKYKKVAISFGAFLAFHVLPAAPLRAGSWINWDSSLFGSGSFADTDVDGSELTSMAQWIYMSSPLSARYGMGFSIDPTNNKSVLFGGITDFGVVLGDTWVLDSQLQWVLKNPSTSPPARYGPELVWIGGKYLLFGGIDASGNYLNDTWIYDPDLNAWSKIDSPPILEPRAFFAMAYSIDQNKVVMFGGVGNNDIIVANTTWIFDVGTLSWSGSILDPSPSARRECAMAFDSTDQKIILFGGRANSWLAGDVYDDTWSFDAANNIWEEKKPAIKPSARAKMSLTFDTQFKQIVLVGGSDASSSYLEDTQYYDLTKNRWLNLRTNAAPLGRCEHKIVYDSSAQRIIMFGGKRDVASNALYTYTITSTGTWTSAPVDIDGTTTLQWNTLAVGFGETLDTSTSNATIGVDLQLASSSDGVHFNPFLGPDGTPGTSFLVTDSNPIIIGPYHDNDHFIKVRAYFFSDEIPERPMVSYIRLDYNRAPSTVMLKSPADNSLTNQLFPQLSWSSSKDDDGSGDLPLLYQLQIDHTTNFFSPFFSQDNIQGNGTDVSTSPAVSLVQGNWAWRVRAKDNEGLFGDWSSAYHLTIDTTTPPDPVTQLDAAPGPHNGDVTLSWVFPNDIMGRVDGGKTIVHISTKGPMSNDAAWANAEQEQTSILNASSGSAVITLITGLADQTLYYFAIKTEDGLGNRSSLSTVSVSAKTFSLPNPVTCLAAKRGPGNGQISLTWIFPGDSSVTNENTYVHLSTSGPILDEAAWDQAIDSRTFSTTASPGENMTTIISTLQNGTTYYCALRMEDSKGAYSPISLNSPFATTNSSPTVTLLSPIGPQTLDRLQLISWQAIDPDPQDVLSLALSFSIDGGVKYQYIISSAVTPGTTTYLWDTSGLPNGSSYRVQVEARDGFGLSAAGASTGNLTKDSSISMPVVVFTNGPAAGQTVSGYFLLSWSVTNPMPYLNYLYTLSLSSDSGHTFVTISSGTKTSYVFDSTVWKNASTYQLNITAQDPDYSTLSGNAVSGSFKIYNPSPPSSFQLLHPLAGDEPCVFNLRFTWENATDINGELIKYSLQYSTNADLSGASVVPNLVISTYVPEIGTLLIDTTYFWQVKAQNISQLETLSPLGQFMILHQKAKSSDGLFSVEVISPLPANDFISIEDGGITQNALVSRGTLDSESNLLVRLLNYPAWDVQIKDVHGTPVVEDNLSARLTCSVNGEPESNVYNPSADISLLKFANLNSTLGRWEPIPTQPIVPSTTHQITAVSNSLSIFSVVGSPTPTQNLTGVTNFPNPFSAGKEITRIRYALLSNSHVTIRIYTMLGDLVHVMDIQSGDAGGVGNSLGYENEVTWDGRNDSGTVVANGMYLMEILAESSDKGTSKEFRRVGVLK